MTRIALAALLAVAAAAPAFATQTETLQVTVSDRGVSDPHSPEAQRIFAQLAAE